MHYIAVYFSFWIKKHEKLKSNTHIDNKGHEWQQNISMFRAASVGFYTHNK